MEILKEKKSVAELVVMAQKMFGNMIKGVVDIRRRIIAVDAELHADEEAFLLEDGSRQEDLWGINLYPEFERDDPDFIEFDSMINLRPSQGNRTRGVENDGIRKEIISVVREWIT